ncbi:MAG: histone deacetylase family protein [Nannocystaceae bacterium]
MFRIRRIHDDLLPTNAAAIAQIQALLRAHFPAVREDLIDALPAQLRDPQAFRFRTVVIAAERGHQILGCAVLLHAPDLRFAFLDYISATPGETGRGIGGALYERVREECRHFGAIGLFFECLPDDPEAVSDAAFLAENQARLRFYERYGARPIDGTEYTRPISPGDLDLPLLVFDDLGSGAPLRRSDARKIVEAILERKYAWLCPAEYVAAVVASITDDPVRLRPLRYTRARPPKAPQGVPEDLKIPLIVNDRHDIHHVRERGYVEAPVRIAAIERELERTPLFARIAPRSFPKAPIYEVHDRAFVDYLQKVCSGLPEGRSVYPYVFPLRNAARMPDDLPVRAGYYCIDTFTPLHHNAWAAARRAVDCALTATARVIDGSRIAYALVRPPGHHAERRAFGGFCYLNSAAIAAQQLSKLGPVAMLDLDYHHGNGQQEIFYDRADVFTASIHGHPRFAYPYFSGFDDEVGVGEGVGKNLNLPLPERIDGRHYLTHLRRALAAVRAFGPRFLVLCLGLDTAKGDPTGTWSLGADDFEANGRLVGELGLPTVVVQEGGYATRRIGGHARAFLRGLWEASHGRVMPEPGA